MKNVGKKGLLLLISGVILASVLLYANSFAWYTKMISMSGLEFSTAKWEFRANNQVDDFLINVFRYSTITEQKAAPGTEGEIPIRLSAASSQTNVTYMISVDSSSMSNQFKQRLYFFYYDTNNERVYFNSDSGEVYMRGAITRGEFSDVKLYWRWLYDYDEYLQKNEAELWSVINVLKNGLTEDERETFFLNEEDYCDSLLITNIATARKRLTSSQITVLNNYKTDNPDDEHDDDYFRYIWSEYNAEKNKFLSDESYDALRAQYGSYDVYLQSESSDLYNILKILDSTKDINGLTMEERTQFFYDEELALSAEGKVTDESARQRLTSAQKYILTSYKNNNPDLTHTTDYFYNIWTTYEADFKAYDKYDTEAGYNPELYESQMNAIVSIVGDQIEVGPTATP